MAATDERKTSSRGSGIGSRGSGLGSTSIHPDFGGWKLPPRSLDPWSKPGIELQMEGVNGIGILSPRFVPYRPIGMPDLVRNRSLLPKYRIYKASSQDEDEVQKSMYDEVDEEGGHVILPLRIKGCQWNGERWCATSFSPNVARSSNGSMLLQSELSKSEQRLKRSRVGEYFLRGIWTPPSTDEKHKGKSCVPPLQLGKVPKFDASEEMEKNSAYMREYRLEARRVASERSRGSFEKPGEEPTVTGMLPKALENYSLEQLSSILGKEVEFSTLRHKFNKQLYQFCQSSDTLRPFTFRRKYANLKAIHEKESIADPNPAASMDQAEVFLHGIEQHPWYKDLAKLVFDGDQSGSRGEWLILNLLRLAVEGGGQFTREDFVPMLYYLVEEGIDLNEPGTVKVLNFMRRALRVPDVALEEFIETCDPVPDWLLSLYHPRHGRLISFCKPTAKFRSKFFSRIHRSTKFSFI